MHFEGKPILNGSIVDMRYKAIQEILQNNRIKQRSIICSSTITNKETLALKKQANGLNWKWYDFPKKEDDDGVGWESFEQVLEAEGINPYDAEVFMCGTTLSGCILYSKETSAIELAKRGFKVSVYLPACAEEELPGMIYPEKLNKSFSKMFRFFKDNEILLDNFDVIGCYDTLREKIFKKN